MYINDTKGFFGWLRYLCHGLFLNRAIGLNCIRMIIMALGTRRGAIKERWFSSVIAANNGPLAAPDEGMSYVAPLDQPENRFSLRDAVAELGPRAVGQELWDQYATWPMYSKFFDYSVPLVSSCALNVVKQELVHRLAS